MSKKWQGHHTEINKTKPKRTEVPTVSRHRQTTVILCSTITIT